MVVFGTYDVCVKIDNEPLPEFDVEVDEERKRATCWIPSEAGKTFSVRYNNIAPLADGCPVKRVELLLDGVWVGVKNVKATGGTNKREEKGGISKLRCQNGATRAFLFAACQFTDEDELFETSQARRLGEIEIRVFAAVEVKRKQPDSPATLGNDSVLPPLKVHERAKKGIVHGAQLGELILPETSTNVPSKPIIWDYVRQRVLATFVFRYRPLDILQANGIAPRPPKAPTRLAEPTDVIDLTLSDEKHEDEDEDNDVRDAEIAALKARIEALERTRSQNQTQVPPTRKRVKSEEEENVNPVIKRERLE